MAERLYYNDPYLCEFDATVRAADVVDGRRVVRLDRTAFYPTSGGQPHDLGTLADLPVTNVIEADDGDVLHVVDGELPVGTAIRGRVDWARRFDHMQQHTGQHVLSAGFDRLLNARTESFHLGADSATIDLGREVTPLEIAHVEDEANRVVWEDREVRISFTDAADAARLPLRKESGREGRLRLIDVDEYDLSACGGTHVARTGSIGIIAVTSWERFKGGTRVGFVCGGRALRAHRKLRDIAAAAGRLLSILPDELPAAIERQQADGKAAKRTIKDLQSKLASHEGAELARRAVDGRVVAAMEGLDQNGLKSVAAAIVERPGHVAALVTTSSPPAIVVARHPASTLDSAAVLKQVIQRFGGKGGGRPELAQGGGLEGEPQAIVSYLLELL